MDWTSGRWRREPVMGAASTKAKGQRKGTVCDIATTLPATARQGNCQSFWRWRMSLETTIRRSLLIAALLGAAYTGTASADEDGAHVATACLRRSDIRTTKILGQRNVLFITRDRTTYNNQFKRQCTG